MTAPSLFKILEEAIVRSWKRTVAIIVLILAYLAAVFEVDRALQGAATVALLSSEGLLFAGTAVLLLVIVSLDLSEKLSTANNANAALSHANAGLQDQLKEFEATKKRMAGLETELADTTRRLAEATSMITELTGNISALEVERESLRTTNATLSAELAETTNRLADASARIAALEQQCAELAGQVADLRQELGATQLRERSAATRVNELERQVAAARDDSLRKDVEIQRERDSTQRAGVTPTLDVTTGTSGFGILAPKTVYVRVRNAGHGDATSVELATAIARREAEVQYRPVAFWAAIPAGEMRQADVATLNQLGGGRELRTRVTYQTRFGPGAPIDVRFRFG